MTARICEVCKQFITVERTQTGGVVHLEQAKVWVKEVDYEPAKPVVFWAPMDGHIEHQCKEKP